MAKRSNASKSQLLTIYKAHKQAEKRNIQEAESRATQANLLITLGILIQFFDFPPEDCEYFVDMYGEVLANYNNGLEDVDEIAERIYEHCGISVYEQ